MHTATMNYPTLPTDLNNELIRLSRLLEDANRDLETHSIKLAHAEHNYSQAKATNYLNFKTDPNGTKRTIPETEAIVDKECSKQQLDCYIARAMKESGLEKVRSLRAQLSALQSISATVRSETELARY